LRPNIRPYFTK